MAARVTLQSLEMRGRGIGWKADRCADPETCDVHLCVVDNEGGYWHPADPLAFAKWRVRAELDAMPGHVVVKVGRSWDALRRGAVVGAVGLGGTAAVLGMWWGRQRIFSMKTLSRSGAYGAKASRSA
jgi:hypothetical protein